MSATVLAHIRYSGAIQWMPQCTSSKLTHVMCRNNTPRARLYCLSGRTKVQILHVITVNDVYSIFVCRKGRKQNASDYFLLHLWSTQAEQSLLIVSLSVFLQRKCKSEMDWWMGRVRVQSLFILTRMVFCSDCPWLALYSAQIFLRSTSQRDTMILVTTFSLAPLLCADKHESAFTKVKHVLNLTPAHDATRL